MISKWEKEREKLIQYINIDQKSYEEIGRIYNCSGSNIKRVANTLNIPLSPRRKINSKETFGKGNLKGNCANCGKPISKSKKFCNSTCYGEYSSKTKYQKILDGDPSIMNADYSPKNFKNFILKEQENKCAICGMEPYWNNKPLVFILDHIDGHASNNKRDNLRCICPNCDSQLDTYKSKNKCSDRIYYHHYNRSAPKEIQEVEEG